MAAGYSNAFCRPLHKLKRSGRMSATAELLSYFMFEYMLVMQHTTVSTVLPVLDCCFAC